MTAEPFLHIARDNTGVDVDDLSRGRLTSGSLASMVARDHVAGVTTNPAIFAKAISGGDDAYAGQLHDLWARGTCVHEALRDLTTHDVRWACDALRPAYDATDGVDGPSRVHRVLAGRRPRAGRMNVNIWDVNDAIQDLVSGGRPVDPARLADPGAPLEEVAG